ncbi:MAG: four-carbon acid sugar kinase family protein [Dermatophilaceae bacterium]
MTVSLARLLDGMPQGRTVTAEEVAELTRSAGRVLVVLDDDPTGTQSVADLPVLLSWACGSLEWALRQGTPAVYVMTNARSLSAPQARARNREVARAAYAAAARAGVAIEFVSRSDSTLRGHFPLETDSLAQEVLTQTGHPVDGVVLVPAFGDAGRITVDAVHYAATAPDGYTPVADTEFARDPSFGYRSSDLRAWVAEKTMGRVASNEVAHVSLRTPRTDLDATIGVLRGLRDAQPVVVDIVEENDLRLLAVALYAARRQGARLVYRVGPPFVRAVIGQEVTPPLHASALADIRAHGPGGHTRGGLIVVGSHVSMTTRQLARLVRRSRPVELGLDVATVLTGEEPQAVAEVAHAAAAALAEGNVVVRTSRTLVRTDDPEQSLAIARRVSTAVVEVVRQVLQSALPRFVLAKGGITSSDVAARGLAIERAMVRGPMLPGTVSVWEPMAGPARGVPYVVFPGNVGGPDSLADVVDTLSA